MDQSERDSIEEKNKCIQRRHNDTRLKSQLSEQWGDPLIQRIERPTCACLRYFNPISRRVTTQRSSACPSLLHLCRSVVLSCVPLANIDKVPPLLPVPLMLARNICRLNLDDFRINPLKVQAQDILSNRYQAEFKITKCDVILEVNTSMDNHGKANGCNQPNFLSSFEDSGALFYIYEPVISLAEVISTLRRVGQAMPTQFIWMVLECVSQHILSHSKSCDWLLNADKVKVTRTQSKIYIETQCTDFDTVKMSNAPPPELSTSYIIHPEKAFIWSLGIILKDILSLMPTKTIRSRSVRPMQNLADCSHKEEWGPQRHLLTDLMQKCLLTEPDLRPSAKDILNLSGSTLQQIKIKSIKKNDRCKINTFNS